MQFKRLGLAIAAIFLVGSWMSSSTWAQDDVEIEDVELSAEVVQDAEVVMAKSYAAMLKQADNLYVHLGIGVIFDPESRASLGDTKMDYSQFMNGLATVANYSAVRDHHYTNKFSHWPRKIQQAAVLTAAAAASSSFFNEHTFLPFVTAGFGAAAVSGTLYYFAMESVKNQFAVDNVEFAQLSPKVDRLMQSEKFWETLKTEGIKAPEKSKERDQWLNENFYMVTNRLYFSLGYLISDLLVEMKSISNEMLHAVISEQKRVSLDPGAYNVHMAIFEYQRTSDFISEEYDPRFNKIAEEFRELNFRHENELTVSPDYKAAWVAKAYGALAKLADRYQMYFAAGNPEAMPAFLGKVKDLSTMRSVCDLALKSRLTI